ncbi:MAG: M24 family metallopeptidase [Granulosicoccus sp.]
MATPPKRGFDEREFHDRCTRIQTKMADADIELLWLTTEADISYITGFQTQFWQSPTRPWHVLLPVCGKPVAVIPSIGLPCMQKTWVEDIRTWSSPDPVDDGVTLLRDAILELRGPQARIGFPMGAETHLRYCWHDVNRLRAKLAKASWIDATDAIRSVRQIKSTSEIEKIAYVCELTSNAFACVPDIIHSGMCETDAFSAFKICCLEQGVDTPAYLVGKAQANGYDDIISPPSDHIISQGDVLILDTGCTWDGYYADFDRNFAFGSVDRKTAEAHQRVWDATEATLTTLRPGLTCRDLFHTLRNSLGSDHERVGLPTHLATPSGSDHERVGRPMQNTAVGRFGHGLGLQLTETPSIMDSDTTELCAGMVITLEPGYSYAPGKIMVHEENVLITDNGARLLSRRAPRDIPVI